MVVVRFVYEKGTGALREEGVSWHGRLRLFLSEDGRYALLCVSGGKAWTARGVYPYYPSEVHLLRVHSVKEDERKIVYTCEFLGEFKNIKVGRKASLEVME